MFLQEHKVILSGHGGKVLDSARGLYKYTSISSDSRTFEVEVSPRLSRHNCTTVCGTYNHTYSPIPLRHSIVTCMVLGNLGRLWLHLSENRGSISYTTSGGKLCHLYVGLYVVHYYVFYVVHYYVKENRQSGAEIS